MADLTEERTQNALNNLRELVTFLQVFGSYAVSSPGLAGSPILSPKHRIRTWEASPRSDASARRSLSSQDSIAVAIVGFGTFGQFLGKAFKKRGHTVYATSRTDYSVAAQDMGIIFCKTEEVRCTPM